MNHDCHYLEKDFQNESNTSIFMVYKIIPFLFLVMVSFNKMVTNNGIDSISIILIKRQIL